MRYFKAFLLLLLILVSGVFIYLKTASLGNPNSNFNQTTRFHLGRYSIMRWLLNLHRDGDAREYFLAGSQPLIIEVAQASNVSLDGSAFNAFVQEVKLYTGRQVAVYNFDTFHPGTLKEADLPGIVMKDRSHAFTGQPNLFVMYAEDFEKQNTEVGETYQEYAIVLSDKRLRDVTAKYPDALPQYLTATLLHEFGHQLGLAHNNQDGCVMNAESSRPSYAGQLSGQYTPTEFCDSELNQLEIIKQSIK